MSSMPPDPSDREQRAEIELFSNGEFHLQMLPDGQDGFRVLAPEVARALAFRDAYRLMESIPAEEKGYTTACTPGGEQRVGYLTEAGFYRALGQRQAARIADATVRDAVERFQRWVFHDVLPQIRRTGSYTIPAQRAALPDITTPTGVLAMAEQFAATARALVAAEQRNAELEPAAKSWTQLATANGDFSVADAAKLLSRDPNIKLGRDRLFTVLRELRWCYRQDIDARHRPYQTAIESGRLSELPCSHYHPRTGELVLDPPQVRVTVKGLGWLHQHLGGTAPLAIDGGAA